jgi:hypothetical protein
MLMDIEETRSVRLNVDGKQLEGRLTVPKRPVGVVPFVTGVAGAQYATLEKSLAARMQDDGLATYVMDLNTPSESADRLARSDVGRLCHRLDRQMEWLQNQDAVADLPTALCGVGTGAAVAVEHVLTTDRNVEGLGFVNGRLDIVESDVSELTVPLSLFVDTEHEYLYEDNQTVYEQSGVEPQHKQLIHSVDRDALCLVAHWVESQVSGTDPPSCEEGQVSSGHSAL